MEQLILVLESSGGFEPKKMKVDYALNEQLKRLNYPCAVRLQFSAEPGYGRRTKWIVTGIGQV